MFEQLNGADLLIASLVSFSVLTLYRYKFRNNLLLAFGVIGAVHTTISVTQGYGLFRGFVHAGIFLMLLVPVLRSPAKQK